MRELYFVSHKIAGSLFPHSSLIDSPFRINVIISILKQQTLYELGNSFNVLTLVKKTS